MQRRTRTALKLACAVIAVGIVAGAVLAVVAARWFSTAERFAFDPESSRTNLADSSVGSDGSGNADVPADGTTAGDEPTVTSEAFDPVLLLGSDQRSGFAGARADVIMVILVPKQGGSPVLFSLPRDLYVHNPCQGAMSRINAGFNGCGSDVSGPELMAILVEDFTGLTVRHVVKVDFDGFTDVIDTLGGVEICSDRPLRDREAELTLPEGCVTADGELALAWVRSRKSQEFTEGAWRRMAGVDDLTRNERQQDVILQVMEQIGSVRSPLQLQRLAADLNESVAVSDTLTLGRAVETAWSVRNVRRGDFIRFEIPVERYRTSGGAEVLRPVESFDVTLDRALR